MTEQLDRYSDKTLYKARNALRKKHVTQDPRAKTVFWVRSSDGLRTYRVQMLSNDFMTCTCTNGRNTGGEPLCFHTAAVLLLIEAAKKRKAD